MILTRTFPGTRRATETIKFPKPNIGANPPQKAVDNDSVVIVLLDDKNMYVAVELTLAEVEQVAKINAMLQPLILAKHQDAQTAWGVEHGRLPIDNHPLLQ